MKNALIYLVMFITVQIAASLGTQLVWQFVSGTPVSELPAVPVMIVSSAIFSAGVIFLFLATKWAEVSNRYLRTRPWGVVFWSVLAAIGSIIPSIWLQEQMPELPNLIETELAGVLKDRWGYLVVGILAPFAEELIFRGAILRSLLSWGKTDGNAKNTANSSNNTRHWLMIAVSALFFAAVHMNPAQMPHAFVMGLLLGWMYYRTGSIIPGVVLHWVNNSVAYILYNVLPNPDAPLVYHFGGSDRAVIFAVLCSLCILIPSLLQLHLRMKRAG